MSYSFQEIQDPQAWDALIKRAPLNSFQQSWEWGEFQKSFDRETRRFVLLDPSGESLSACQISFFSKPFPGYWFAPRGPVFFENSQSKTTLMRAWGDFFKKTLRKRGLFFRVEPVGEGMENFILPASWIRTHTMSVSLTLLINLTKSEEALLAEMHSKMRYNIRVAEKHGVTVREGNADDLEAFLAMTKETADRDQFTPRSLEYLKKTWKFLHPKKMCRLRVAEYLGKPLAASMEIAFGDTVTYLHGASSSFSRELMAPYALHWDAIRTAKKEGHAFYDFWGVNPESAEDPHYKKSWEGITRFKLGWGGKRVNTCGTWDLPVQSWIYKLAFSLRKG